MLLDQDQALISPRYKKKNIVRSYRFPRCRSLEEDGHEVYTEEGLGADVIFFAKWNKQMQLRKKT